MQGKRRAKKSNNEKGAILKENENQRANGTFEYKYRDAMGKRHSIYAKTLPELREKEKKIQKDILNGIKSADGKKTLNDMYERWKELKVNLRANTFRNYCYMYEQYVFEAFGQRKIADIAYSDVKALYIYYYDSLHLKLSTIDSIHTVLHQVFDLAVRDSIIYKNPSDSALTELKRAHNTDQQKRIALELEEQFLLEKFLAKQGQYNHWYPIFVTILYTGMRVGEVTGLRWCDVDFEKKEISVNHTLVYFQKGKGCGFSINDTKTVAGKRIIPMAPIVEEALKKEKDYQEEAEIKCGASVDGYEDFIFVNRFGNVQHQGTLNKALRRIIRDCNYDVLDGKEKIGKIKTLPPFSCHNLRHTFATRMNEAKVDLKVRKEVLGHEMDDVTLGVYTHATKEFIREELNKCFEYIDEKKQPKE